MPLASLPFTGCETGHAPSTGSTAPPAPSFAFGPGLGALGAEVRGGAVGRGIGGNGNGAGSHAVSVAGAGMRARYARHTANIAPATTPAPRVRFAAFFTRRFSPSRSQPCGIPA